MWLAAEDKRSAKKQPLRNSNPGFLLGFTSWAFIRLKQENGVYDRVFLSCIRYHRLFDTCERFYKSDLTLAKRNHNKPTMRYSWTLFNTAKVVTWHSSQTSPYFFSCSSEWRSVWSRCDRFRRTWFVTRRTMQCRNLRRPFRRKQSRPRHNSAARMLLFDHESSDFRSSHRVNRE